MGSHLANILPEAVVYDKNESPHIQNKLIKGDILDRKMLFHSLKGFDTVYHLAALADLDKSWNNPKYTIHVNVLGTWNVLEACRLNGVKNFYFASSLYADSDVGSLYGYTKKMGELFVKAYHQQCGLNYCILRFVTLYGTRADETNSIHRFLKQALEGEIKYYGTGEEIREYIHVRDACKMIKDTPCENQTLMITGHQRLKVKEVLDMIAEMVKGTIVTLHQKNSLAHYNTISTRLTDSVKKVFPTTTEDFGSSLIEIMEEINEGSDKIHTP